MLDVCLLLASKNHADVKTIAGDFDGRFTKVVSDAASDGLVLNELQQPLDKAVVQALLARPSRENRGIALKEKKINEETFEKNISCEPNVALSQAMLKELLESACVKLKGLLRSHQFVVLISWVLALSKNKYGTDVRVQPIDVRD